MTNGRTFRAGHEAGWPGSSRCAARFVGTMRGIGIYSFVLVYSVLAPDPARAATSSETPASDKGTLQAAPNTQTEATRVDSEAAERYARQLDDPRYEVRQSASDALIMIGPPAYSVLRRAFSEARTYEARHRIRQIVKRIFVEERTESRRAFLGIQHQPGGATPDPRLPAGTVGVLIVDVISDTAAERAGLRRGDLIVRLNGENISSDPQMPIAAWIGTQSPGTECELEILRGTEMIRLNIELGRRPWNLTWRDARPDQERFINALSSFPDWWRESFDPDGLMPEPSPSVDDPRWRLRPSDRR
jgi:C-terminal processing protease CtpA/Prc